jgi:murein DD-endopeptidase MepM/ murein hydrolase activator NlpD
MAMVVGGCVPRGAASPDAPPPPVPMLETEIANLPETPPAWEAKRATPEAKLVEGTIYRVQAGDTLRAIGNRTGAGSEAIARANDLAAPYVLKPGQMLRVPAGRYHQVGQGETGIAIARAYGVGWADIIALNGLAEPFVLRVGQRLMLPTYAAPPARQSIEQRAAAFKLDIASILSGGEPAQPEGQSPAAPAATAARKLPPTAAVAMPASFAGGFGWPATGRLLARFGPTGKGQVNQGVNIALPQGSEIKAAADGVVAYVGDGVNAYGGLILIRHGGGWATAYGHASALLVSRGQAVKRGQVVARSGQSGFAEQPQLHFEIRQNSRPVDPLKHLPPG